MSWFGYQWRSSRSWSGLVTLVNGDIPVSGDASASTVVNREAVYRNGKHLRCFFALGTFMCFSRPVRWWLLDFMSAVPPPAPPPPDLNCKLLIAVVPAGPSPQARGRSVPRRTSTASSGSECLRRTATASSGSKCSLPDLNCELRIGVFPAGPQPQKISEDLPGRMPENMSEDMPEDTPE